MIASHGVGAAVRFRWCRREGSQRGGARNQILGEGPPEL